MLHISRRMNTILEKILKCVQKQTDRSRVPRKPAILPTSTLEDMDAFERIDDDNFLQVVSYFEHIRGYNLKEALNLCLKEALTDSVTRHFTWWGREGHQRPLYNARVTLAIYEAVCNNRYFDKPTRSEFQSHMKETLRTAKERCRSRRNNPRRGGCNARDFWNDDEEEDTENATPANY